MLKIQGRDGRRLLSYRWANNDQAQHKSTQINTLKQITTRKPRKKHK